MCGIAGIWRRAGDRRDRLVSAAETMGAAIRHRGPDGAGVWVDEKAGVALAQQRLAIIDLSEAGRQPMISSCGRFVLVYNGELYNTDELRRHLTACGRVFRGHSDTEAIVESFSQSGVEQTLASMRGMFAFALFDRETRRLTLARDRFGIKPLYVGQFGDEIVFGSELKAIAASGDRPWRIDPSALHDFMRFGYVPAPASIWRGVSKLRPGFLMTFHADGRVEEKRYWSALAAAASARSGRTPRSDEAVIDDLDAVLRDSVRRHMVSDVPIGAFLSGGVDSSLVAAMMQKVSPRPIRTFTIAFDEGLYNEAEHASAVAHHIGSEHTELKVTEQDARDVVPLLPDIYDEPFADPSQIPTFLLCRLTRNHVTVALSGDGGDELFAGYNRYQMAQRLLSLTRLAPAPLLSGGAGALGALLQGAAATPVGRRLANASDQLLKLSEVLDGDRRRLYLNLTSVFRDPGKLLRVSRGADDHGAFIDDAGSHEFLDYMQMTDVLRYLPDDILAKVDRSSMAVSLEARVPIIDHVVAEHAWSLPTTAKMRGGVLKWALRQTLYRHVPQAIVDRPKKGFGAPIDGWLRGALRGWAEELLAPTRLANEGLFEPAEVARIWRDHQTGARNLRFQLWNLLMFQAWLERWGKGAAAPNRAPSEPAVARP
jgi:asparagine synthase (glutamine-hydrolysing)